MFPYEHTGFLGHETALLNVFTFWKHYHRKYVEELKKVPVLEDDFLKFRNEMGYEYDLANEF